MNYYEIINECIKALRRNKDININLRNIIEISKDESILLVCDTDDGIVTSTEPWFTFKVLVPQNAFTSSTDDVDAQAKMPPNASLETKATLRISYRIYKAYKKAAKQIGKSVNK